MWRRVARAVRDTRSAQVNNAKDRNNAKEHANSAQDRRFARRELAQLSKAEAAADAERQQKLSDAEFAQARAAALADTVRAAEQAHPSFEALVEFIVSEFVTRLPSEECQVCSKRVMPASPTAKALSDPEHPERPIRVYCGHWCVVAVGKLSPSHSITRPVSQVPLGMPRRVLHAAAVRKAVWYVQRRAARVPSRLASGHQSLGARVGQ